MTRTKVVLTHTEAEPTNAFSDASLAALERCAGVVRNRSGRVLAGGELAQAAVGCQVIVAHRSAPGQAATFAQAPALLAFIRTAVDVSTIDVEAASSHGVLVTRASAGFGVAVSELALAMMLDLSRGISRARMAYARGEEPVLAKGLQLRGMSLGLLGFGTIGRHLAMLARGIGMPRALGDAFAARQVDKRYEAVVDGVLPALEAWSVIDAPLVADWPRRPLQKTDPAGKPSLTRWRALPRRAEDDGKEAAASYVLLEPLTGRSHQLRVHLLAIGHPILGDKFYAPPEALGVVNRLTLHAQELSFYHPITDTPVVFNCEPDF